MKLRRSVGWWGFRSAGADLRTDDWVLVRRERVDDSRPLILDDIHAERRLIRGTSSGSHYYYYYYSNKPARLFSSSPQGDCSVLRLHKWVLGKGVVLHKEHNLLMLKLV
jgi:hypothetical protein